MKYDEMDKSELVAILNDQAARKEKRLKQKLQREIRLINQFCFIVDNETVGINYVDVFGGEWREVRVFYRKNPHIFEYKREYFYRNDKSTRNAMYKIIKKYAILFKDRDGYIRKTLWDATDETVCYLPRQISSKLEVKND